MTQHFIDESYLSLLYYSIPYFPIELVGYSYIRVMGFEENS